MGIFCERLKELRQEKELSTIQLGKELQVSDSTITRWENGQREPTMSSIIKLCNFFDVSADYLIGLKDY